ncbi:MULTISPECIES: hypothetical protein [Gemella]|uniref:hypothetical protein n=1 Tax=Gemella TaxID=1378 RepID=UPI0007682DBE|nr:MULTISPECIES: hypothetical protein [Gemella]AME10123.1 hypothetical protein AXE85_08155 [Gemella sp. oral taxon 928]AXI26259.1 hypothetical protein CG018_01750 [Gemella sp. ND 6198]
MNIADYKSVVEVIKHDKKEWISKFLEFNIYEHPDFYEKLVQQKKNYYLCEKEGKIYLVDSDNNKKEISWVSLDNFEEVEIGEYIYKKYRVLK